MSLLPSRPEASPSEDAGPRVIGVDSDAADDVLSALSSETARNLLAEVHDDPAPPSELAERVDTSLQNAQYHLEKLEDAGAVEVVDTAYSAKGREMDVYAAADQPLVIFAGDQDDGSVLRTALQRLVGALGVLALASLAVQALFGRLSLSSGGADAGAGGAGGGAGGGDGGGATTSGDAGAAGVEGTPTPEVTETPTPEAAETPTPEMVETPTPEPMATGTPMETATPTPEPMATGTPTEIATETPSALRTPAPTGTPEAYEEIAGTPTAETVAAAADVGREAAAGLPPGLLFFAGGAFVLAVVTAAWYLRQ